MNSKQLLILAALVLGYYYFYARKSSAGVIANLNPSTGRPRGIQTSASTFSSAASTTPRMGRQPIGLTNAAGGGGTGFVSAPVARVGALSWPGRRNIGTGVFSRTLSRAWSGVGSGLISPVIPTTPQTSTGPIRTRPGFVQIPSYAAVPTITRAAGGSGAVVNLGGGR